MLHPVSKLTFKSTRGIVEMFRVLFGGVHGEAAKKTMKTRPLKARSARQRIAHVMRKSVKNHSIARRRSN